MNQSVAWKNSCNCAENDETINFTEEEEAQRSKFKVINYIPSRYRTKSLWYIGGSIVVVFILLVTTITVVCKPKDMLDFSFHSKTIICVICPDVSIARCNHSKIFLVINNTNVMLHDLETDDQTPELKAATNSIISAFEIHENNQMYWIENFPDSSRLLAQINGSQQVLMEEKKFKPNALTVDLSSENVYATDGNTGILAALSLHSGYFCILLTDLIRPRDLVLDSGEKNIFILQHLHSIVRLNMDGSEPTQIITNNQITALTIDTSRKRLYWINDHTNIQSSNYDGEKQQLVYTDTAAITSVTVTKNRLFWMSSTTYQSTNLLSCEIDSDNICKQNATHEVNVSGNVTAIRDYSAIVSSVSNPCQVNNGNCEQLCLPSGRNKSSCACRMGWQLNSDHRSCQEVRDFILYPYGDVVRTCSLDGKQEVFWPTPYKIKKLTVKTEIDFDYDAKNDYFYFTDDHHIHRTKLKSYSEQETVLSVDNEDMILDDITYDWFTGNMFYGQRHVNASLDHSLMVFNIRLGEAYRKTLNIFEDDQFNVRSYAMIIHPTTGYLFVAITHEDEEDTIIYRFKVNDIQSRRSYHFFAEDIQDHRFFTIDYATDRLYAIHATGEKTWVGYKAVDSLNLNFAGEANFCRARTIGIHQQWLYLSNFSSIYRFDKETMGDMLRIAPRIEDPEKKVVGVRIISEDVVMKGLDNPCVWDNGGCERFCFSGATAKCDCEDGKAVTKDGHCY